MSATEFRPRRYMDLFVKLPQALHPKIRRALLISFGVGVTARALVDLPDAERIDVVGHFPRHPEDVPRFRPARPKPPRRPASPGPTWRHWFVSSSRTGAGHYDLITGEPPPPQMAGVCESLHPGSISASSGRAWQRGASPPTGSPCHSLGESSARAVVGAFLESFPDATLWSGSGLDLILMGSRGGIRPASRESLGRPFAGSGVEEMRAHRSRGSGTARSPLCGGRRLPRGVVRGVPP